ncbi:MAG: sulfotransferase [Isosphaeraceae bacterium]|nr:sulfotransferase [Isosphaeraceae bacterium]
MTIEVGRREAGSTGLGEEGAAPIWDYPYRPAWVRVLNAVGRVMGRRWPSLDPEALMAEAQRRAGLSDWGDDSFREGLEVLATSFEEQGHTHTFGRLFFREYCLRMLVNRLKIQDDLKRYPEILEVPIRRPVIITGFPRSGTTLLHRLLAEAPFARSLLFWEALEPSPPPTAETRRTDPRIARARRTLKTLYALSPRLAAAHLYEAESPEECNNLFAHAFRASINAFLFDVPRYFDWLGEQEWIGPYQYMRRQLQLLSWRCPGDHWVLKAPGHIFVIDVLLTIFPDASIIQTHRDPLQMIPSLCSLASAFRGITAERVDLRRLGAELTEVMAVGIERAMKVRASADPARFFDVSYPALVADPIGTVRTLCAHFGYPCDATFETRMRRWLAENPQHKHGVHRYSLEQFGLDPDALNRRFAAYHAWRAAHLPALG